MVRPLAGFRIVDLTVAWAGPMSNRILAALGADVIHIEGPGRPDSWRGPVGGGDPRRYPDGDYGERPYDRNVMFNVQNQGKRGVAVDLKHPAGVDLIRRLAAVSDALVANFTPGTLTRMGLSPEVLGAANPELVVMEMPAFGASGPLSRSVALGPSMEAAAGMAHFVGYGDGRPYVTGPAYMDPIGAFNGAATLITALYAARHGHPVRHVELPQTEAGMHWIGEQLLAGVVGADRVPRGPNAVVYAEPHGAFPAAGEDEWIAIAVRDDAQWQRLKAAVGRGPVADDPAFDSVLVRRRRAADVYDAVSTWTRDWPKEALADRLQAAGVPAAPVCRGPDVAVRPDLWSTGYFQQFDHPAAGTHWYQTLPLDYGTARAMPARPAPTFGQHNAEVLRDLLELSEAEWQHLLDEGVVADRPNQPASAARRPEVRPEGS